MSHSAVLDAMTGGLHDPFGHGHMGVTAENIAAKYGFTREQQDQFSIESHRKAANAIEKGYFKDQVVPTEIRSKKGVEHLTTDEHVRKDASMADLAKRSEERRVGKECRSGWAPDHERKKDERERESAVRARRETAAHSAVYHADTAAQGAVAR